jgi:hypothetical protein
MVPSTTCPFVALPLLVLLSIFRRLRLGVPVASALLVYSEEGSLRSGVACFVLAIEGAIMSDLMKYNAMLTGDQEYKKEVSRDNEIP